MSFVIRQSGQGLLVLSGDLVAGDAELRLETAAMDAIEAGAAELVFDVTGVGFVDSAGLGAILRCRGLTERAATRLVLRGVQPKLARLLEMARLDEVLNIEREHDA